MSGLAMRAALLLCIVGAVGGAGSLASAADADATVTVAVSRVDMRKVSPEDARERAVKSSRNDMALVVFGDDATAIQETQDAALDALIRSRADTVYHPVGTCRMGSDADAVVDTSLKLNGIDGIWVADASIMPTVTRANTNLTSIMIGEMVGEWVRTRGAELYGL